MSPHADKILDNVTASVVDLLIQNPSIYYNKSQLARHAQVSRDALYDRLEPLLEYEILEEADVDMDRTHYQLNPDAEATNAIEKLLYPEGDRDN